MVQQLEQLIESRSKKEFVVGGEYFACIGLLMIAVMSINKFFVSGWWIWLMGIAGGWVGIFVYDYFREQKNGRYSTRIQKEVFTLWILFGIIICPLLVVIFPGYLNLYSYKAIYPLIYLILSFSLWMTGIIAVSSEFKAGAVIFLAGTILSIFFNSPFQLFWIFNIIMLTGLVIPGIVSKYNECRR